MHEQRQQLSNEIQAVNSLNAARMTYTFRVCEAKVAP